METTDKKITLAVHTLPKAVVLKKVLEENNISVFLENIDSDSVLNSETKGVRVLIYEKDISKALILIEERGLFRYDDEKTHKIDDGKKRVLVAIDFSSYSIKACQAAFQIAKEHDAKVKILHVYSIRYPLTFPFADAIADKSDDTILNRTRKQMLQFCFEIDSLISSGDLPSVNYSYSLREGVVEDEVESFIKEYRPNILVIGTKGASNKETNSLGNVTADIIEMTDIPVLAVPEHVNITEDTKNLHVAFLTNLQKSDLDSFDTLSSILNLYKIRVTLVHINLINKKGDKWADQELTKMKEYCIEKYKGSNIEYKLIDSPDLPNAISDYISSDKVTMIALNTRKRNIFGRMFAPSMSRKILLKSDVSLLVLRG